MDGIGTITDFMVNVFRILAAGSPVDRLVGIETLRSSGGPGRRRRLHRDRLPDRWCIVVVCGASPSWLRPD